MTWNKYSRFWALVTLLWVICVFAAGCTAAWTSEAINIVNLLVPSITSILSILAAFGIGIPANAMADIQSWANQATAALETVAGLIDQYNTAAASAQPGILTEIQTALNTVVANLQTILPEIHVTDANTQAKIAALLGLVANEMQALINLVPALKGEVKAHSELKKLMAALKAPDEFKNEFNDIAGTFGKQYELK